MSKSPLEIQFAALLKNYRFPNPEREYKFVPDRKWRFDFAYPDKMIAIEIEGGVWNNGAHTRGRGYIEDTIKYNRAAIEGWTLLRYTADTMGMAVDDLKLLFKKRK